MFKLPYWLMFMMSRITKSPSERYGNDYNYIHITPKWDGFVVEGATPVCGLIAYLPKDYGDPSTHNFYMRLPKELAKKPAADAMFDTVAIDDSVLDQPHDRFSPRKIPIQISALYTMMGLQELSPLWSTDLISLISRLMRSTRKEDLFTDLSLYTYFDLSFLYKNPVRGDMQPVQHIMDRATIFEYHKPIEKIQLLGVSSPLRGELRPIWNPTDPTLFCLIANDGKAKLSNFTYADPE